MMVEADETDYLPSFIERMEKAGLPPIVIDTFAWYYRQVVSGEKGLIFDRDIYPINPEDIGDADQLDAYTTFGRQALDKTVMIVLNGGLGTSMGLSCAKSLLDVKNGKSFIDITLAQGEKSNVRIAFMNSFSTHADTVAAVTAAAPSREPFYFVQHKFPKIIQNGFTPAEWPKHPELEWNPPGHGDIYTALYTSGMIERLLDEGITYAFISNSDNLGAILDPSLLGYFVNNHFPFMMEVAERTPADLKGGHLAKHRNGRLLLREIAQCPADEIDAFQDIHRYRFFNTNSLWINLENLRSLIKAHDIVPLPIILNPKNLDPKDPKSPLVYQVETAMGAAVSLFQGAAAVKIPDSRFFPVKKCSDLLAVRSDCFVLEEGYRLMANPNRTLGRIKIDLDPRFYGTIDKFDQRFKTGIPSLVNCVSLVVEGDLFFEENVTIIGRVTIKNNTSAPVVIKKGTVIDGDLIF